MLALHNRSPILSSGMSAKLAFVRGLSPALWLRYGLATTASWPDSSGNGRTLTHFNSPTINADGSVTYNGTTQRGKCDAFTLNQPETVYLLGRYPTFGQDDTNFDGNAAASMALHNRASSNRQVLNAGSDAAANTDWILNTYAAVCCVFNGPSSLIQVNKNAATTGNPGAANAGGFTLGARGGASNFAHLQVKEVIVYAAAHDAATRARIIRYLSIVGQLGI